MKIICDNCGAKYSIADEKVKGKVFKIRCKKCQESIVVRGDEQPKQEAPPAAAPAGGDVETKVFDYSGYKTEGGDDPVWYVAVDGGEQQGPYSTNQMREYLAAGNVAPESFIWKEGFDDWKAASDVPEISGGGGGAAAAAAAATPAAGAAGGLFDSGPAADAGSGGGGLFDSGPTADAGSGGGGLFDSGPAADAGGGGLFDSGPAASAGGGGLFDGGGDASGGDIFSSTPDPGTGGGTGGLFDAGQDAPADGGGLFDGGGDVGAGDLFSDSDSSDDGGIFASTEAPSSSPRVSTEAAMTGQRNENSVLFSLSNLQALASDAAPSGGAASPGPSFGGNNVQGAGMATNEASGLIDIRAMASSLAAEAEKADDVDDMLALGGGGFAPTLGAPVLTASNSGSMSTGVKIAIIGGAVLLLAAIVVGVIIVLQSGSKGEAEKQNEEKIALLMRQIEEMQKGGGSAEDIKKIQEKLIEAKQEQKQLGDDVQPMPEEGEAEAGDDKSSSSSKKKRSSSSSSKSSSSDESSSSSSAASAPQDKPAAKAPSKSTSELDALLGGGSAKKKPAAKPAAAPSGGGAKLTRQQVISGMNAVKSSVQRCGAGKSGKIMVKAKIAPDGRVEQATTTGDFAGTPEGTCAARAVRRARFPQSSAATTVTYPFTL